MVNNQDKAVFESAIRALETERIKNSIDTGMAQIENGQFMSLDESRERLYKALFNKSAHEKI